MIYLLWIALISVPFHLLSSDNKSSYHKIGKYTFYSAKTNFYKSYTQQAKAQSLSKEDSSNSAKNELTLPKGQTEKDTFKKTDASTESFDFIYDSYTDRRGTPKMLAIFCNYCDARVMHYQKDGPGRLLRCYLDRIHTPEELHNRQYDRFNTRTSPHLKCLSCRAKIGTPMIYRQENRPAYHLIQKSFYIKDVI